MKSLSEEFEDRTAAYELQQAKFKALRDALGNYDNYKYVNFYDFLDPNNQYWNDYEYKLPGDWFEKQHGRIEMDSPVGWFINNIRNAKNTDDIKKQLDIWNSYKPLDLPHNGESYVNHFIYGLNKAKDYGGSRPVFPTTDGSDPVQTSTGGAQGVVTVGGAQGTQGVQGAQAGAKSGNAVAGGGVQGSNNGSGGAQGAQAGNGTLASAGVPRGGTKTIGYDPNPGNVSLAYAMRNAPEQERRTALIDKWNQEHGRSGSTGYATGEGMLTSGSNGTYATGEGIKDANGNVLTNPGGDWEYQYALKNPQYGLGMMGKMSDAQRNYLQAVSDDMGYNYNFKGATRFV